MKLTLDREVISPKQAREYLELNTHNRNLRAARVATLVGAIKRGEWVETGDPIKFNGEVVLDGQHRLEAIAKAGKRVPVWVARGVGADAQEVIDTGSRRTVGDMLKLRGYAHWNVLAAVARGIWQYRNSGEVVPEAGWASPTAQQVLQIVEDEPVLVERAKFAQAYVRRDPALRLPTSLTGACLHLFAEKATDEDGDEFFNELITPKGPNTPPGLLRTRLLRVSTTHAPISGRLRAALLIKAWNAWATGEPLGRLTWRAGAGSKKEDFPEIRGVVE